MRVTAPLRARDRDIAKFLDAHQGWIEDRLSRRPAHVAFNDGAVIPFRGMPHAIRATGKVRGHVYITPSPPSGGEGRGEGTWALTPAENTSPPPPASRRPLPLSEEGEFSELPAILVPGLPEHLPRRLKTWLKAEARSAIEASLAARAHRLPQIAAVSLRDTTSRWGSCSATRRLSFSWRLILAPSQVLDYVAAHEAAHLIHMNHGPQFWALCENLAPQTKTARAWLKANGAGLHRFG